MHLIQRTLLASILCLTPALALPASPASLAPVGFLSAFAGPMWTNGIVPYEFDQAVTQIQRSFMLRAFEDLEGVCGVRFVPRGNESNYITIRPFTDPACPSQCSNSAVGMRGGQQFVSVGSAHWSLRYVLIHELMHTLGYEHEHKRPDRDTYVEYTPAWVDHSFCGGSCHSQFDINQSIQTFGTPYDFESVMHYGPEQFTNGQGPPLQARQAYAQFEPLMGNTTYLSVIDVVGLQAVYGLPNPPQLQSVVPGNVLQIAPPSDLTLTGSGFYRGPGVSSGVQGTRVLWNGTPISAQVIDSTTIEVPLSAQLLATPGCHEIRVENPVVGGGLTSVQMVNIVDLSPTVDRFRGTQPGDELGASVASIPDVDGDGRDDMIIGAPGTAAERGRVTCYSGATGAVLWGYQSQHVGERLGHSVAVLGDLDGDTVPDVVAGAPAHGNLDSGRILVLSGADGSVIRASYGLLDMEFGHAVANAGDLTGDGVDDIIVGAPGLGGNQGMVRVLNGQNGSTYLTLNGSGGRFGAAVAGGVSLGGFTTADIVVGAPNASPNGRSSGQIQIFEGGNGNLMKTLNGDAPFNRLGWSLTIVPGMQFRSGFNLVAGAPGGSGYVRIYKTSTFGYLPHLTIPGQGSNDLFGYSVAFAGDLDQDGRGELIVGAPQLAGDPGYVQVLSGEDQSVVFAASGEASGSRFGAAVAAAGDSNADTRGSVLVGVPDRDVWCEDGGEAVILHPMMPPAIGRLLITEVTWDQPDGVELTWFGASGVNLSGWTLEWNQNTPNVASLSGFLNSGEPIIVSELGGGPFPGAPQNAHHLEAFGPIGTSSQAFEVILRSPTGLLVDAVRIDGAAQLSPAPEGGPFRGLARRGVTDRGMERIWGLDSNSGADWTAETKLSMGRENRNTGNRGTDPISVPRILINEINPNPDHVELVRANTNAAIDLRNWYFLASARNGSPISVIRPWRSQHEFVGSFEVVGEGAPPMEMPQGTVYTNVTALGENFPMTGDEFSLALYDSHGRLVDLVRTMGEDFTIGHNHPRLPAPRAAFRGFAPRTTLGARGLGRTGSVAQAQAHGGAWRPIGTRSLGTFNSVNWFFGDAGTNELIDARIHMDGNGDLTCIVRADRSLASQNWGFVVSSGHLNGTGPFFGLGEDALTNFVAFGMQAPFTGPLDGRHSARFDLAGPIPVGIDLDFIFFTFTTPATPSGSIQITSQTSILEFDS